MTDLREHGYETTWGWGVIRTANGAIVGVTPPTGGTHGRVDDPVPQDALDPRAPLEVQQLARSLARYLDGDLAPVATRDQVAAWLAAAGVTGFRRDVSLALFDVPVGITLSYGELAAQAGRPGAARAVGTTCSRNPLPLVVPCHRVVHVGARRGDVGTYGAATGSDYKCRLLVLEDAALVRGSGRMAP